MDDETQHTWRPVYVGRIRADGQFDLVWSSEKPVRPIPYPSSRSHAEWDAFLERPVPDLGRLGKSRSTRQVAQRAVTTSWLRSAQHRQGPPSPAGVAWLSLRIEPRCQSLSRFVQVRPAMTLRSGSFVLSRISITTQLLIWFLCLSLIPCVVLTGIISYLSNQSLKRTVRQGLLAISDAKTTQLETSFASAGLT